MKCGMVAATLALTLVLLAGCGGGGNDQAKVEADLQRYMLGMPPEQTGFGGDPVTLTVIVVPSGSHSWSPCTSTSRQSNEDDEAQPVAPSVVINATATRTVTRTFPGSERVQRPLQARTVTS